MIYDTIIIGAGPSGMSAALYLARYGRKALIIAGFGSIGGQLLSTEYIENYIGVGKISAPMLALNMKSQIEDFRELITVKEEEAVNIKLTDSNEYIVDSTFGESFKGKTILFATGATYRHLGIEREDEFASYCATCDADFHIGKDVVVVGGGESAFEEAEILSRQSKSVRIVHRRDVFRASHAAQQRLQERDNISISTFTNVEEITNEGNLILVGPHGKEEVKSSLFVAIGQTPNTQIIKDSSLEKTLLTDDGYIINNNPTEGFYACGDVVSGNHKQVSVAVGDGAKVAIEIDKFLTEKG